MQDISDLLRAHKVKVTPQRLCVYGELADARCHLSAEEVCKKVTKNMPAISLGTVYAALNHLKEKGLVREIKIDFEKSAYEARRDPHHHFLCKKCKNIFDIDIHPCMTLKTKKINGHTIDDFQGYFYGTCKKCQGGKK